MAGSCGVWWSEPNSTASNGNDADNDDEQGEHIWWEDVDKGVKLKLRPDGQVKEFEVDPEDPRYLSSGKDDVTMGREYSYTGFVEGMESTSYGEYEVDVKEKGVGLVVRVTWSTGGVQVSSVTSPSSCTVVKSYTLPGWRR